MKILFASALVFSFTANSYAQEKYVDSLINWTKLHPKVDSVYILTLHRISYSLCETDLVKSYDYYEKISSLSDSLNFTYGKALAEINLAIIQTNYGYYESANKAYIRAIDLAESCAAPRLKAIALNNLGHNFKTAKDFGKCRQYLNEAIPLNIKLKAWRGVATNYQMLMECAMEENLYSDAKKNLLAGIPYAIEIQDNFILSQFYCGFGKLNAIDGKTDSALFYFEKAINTARLDDNRRDEYEVYLAKARYLKPITWNAKVILLDSALKIAMRYKYLEGISDAAQQLSSIYDLKENKDSSLYFYRIFRTASDSLFAEKYRLTTIQKESEMIIKRKESEFAQLKKADKLQKVEINLKNRLLLTTIISFSFFIIILFFVNYTLRLKKKKEQLNFTQKITEIEMQALRAQMNPHFIFNSLNSIENFMMKNEKRIAIDYLAKFALLMRMILDSSRNELVPFTKDLEAMKLYVELEQFRYKDKFAVTFTIDPILLNEDYFVPPLLIQPFVENAIAHGLSKSNKDNLQLLVAAIFENDYILYTIQDNGIGRKKSAFYAQQNQPFHKSMGMQITHERISIFNEVHHAECKVTITDLYDENKEALGTKVLVKLKAI